MTYTSTVYQLRRVDVGESLFLGSKMLRELESTTRPAQSLPPTGNLPAFQTLPSPLFLTQGTSFPVTVLGIILMLPLTP